MEGDKSPKRRRKDDIGMELKETDSMRGFGRTEMGQVTDRLRALLNTVMSCQVP
jgi:hypothetical protein